MKKIITLISVLLLLGCVNTPKDKATFASIIELCNLTSVNAKYGDCIKTGLDEKVPHWVNYDDAEYIRAYISWSNAAGARVDSGEMTADQARAGAADLMSRLSKQAAVERQNNQARADANMAMFFSGLAVLGASQPSYNYPPPSTTTYTYRGSRPITCTTMNNMVNCM